MSHLASARAATSSSATAPPLSNAAGAATIEQLATGQGLVNDQALAASLVSCRASPQPGLPPGSFTR